MLVRGVYETLSDNKGKVKTQRNYSMLFEQLYWMVWLQRWALRDPEISWGLIEGHFTPRDWEPVAGTLKALSLVEKAEPVQVQASHLHSKDHRSMWMQDGCKVYMDSYTASNGSCVMVTWTIFKNRLLEVGLTQNRTLNAHNCWFILFYHAWGPRVYRNSLEMAFGWGPGHIWLHTTLEGPWPQYMMLEVSWDGLWTLSFGAFTIPWSWLLARVWTIERPRHSKLSELLIYSILSCMRTLCV